MDREIEARVRSVIDDSIYPELRLVFTLVRIDGIPIEQVADPLPVLPVDSMPALPVDPMPALPVDSMPARARERTSGSRGGQTSS